MADNLFKQALDDAFEKAKTQIINEIDDPEFDWDFFINLLTKEGTPLVGASVMVVGQKTGETTGANGNFTIQVPANAKNLRISYVGYQAQDVAISGESNISVTLESSATNFAFPINSNSF